VPRGIDNKSAFNGLFKNHNAIEVGNTAELHLSGLNGKATHSDMKKIRTTGFFLTIGCNGRLRWEKFLQTATVRLHIYLRTNKTLLHNSLYVFDN
jgi:hypothetical protein